MLEHWSQGLQIGLPNLMVPFFSSFFQPWGVIQGGYQVQHLLVTWGGQIEKFFFSISALTLYLKAFRADFNFCNNRNAGWIWVEHWP
jgi:hypothetical protein